MSHAKSSGLRKMALTKSGHSKAGSITDMGGIYRTNIYGLMRKKVVQLIINKKEGGSKVWLTLFFIHTPDGALF